MTMYQTVLFYLAAARILLSRLLKRGPAPAVRREARALCIGLDGAGKTSLLKRASDASADLSSIVPTTGFNVRSVNVDPDWSLEVWDVGGAVSMRPFWSRYVDETIDGLIWVVDGADIARLPESAAELRNLLQREPRARMLPLLVLANKSDIAAAHDAAAVAAALELENLERFHLAVGPRHATSVAAADGRSIGAALTWLCNATEERL